MDRITCKHTIVTAVLTCFFALVTCDVLPQHKDNFPAHENIPAECRRYVIPPVLKDEQITHYIKILKSKKAKNCRGALCSPLGDQEIDTHQENSSQDLAVPKSTKSNDILNSSGNKSSAEMKNSYSIPSERELSEFGNESSFDAMIFEYQLMTGYKLKKNVFKLIGNILYYNKQLNRKEISAFKDILHVLKENRIFSPTLLLLLNKISTKPVQEQLEPLFELLEDVVPSENKYEVKILMQTPKSKWSVLTNDLNLMNNIQTNLEIVGNITSKTNFAEYIQNLVNMINDRIVKPSNRLVAALLLNLPCIEDITDAINFIANYLLEADSLEIAPQFSSEKDLISAFLNGLKSKHNDPQLHKKVNEVIRVLKNSELYNSFEKQPKIETILNDGRINYEKLFEMYDYNNFPDFVKQAKRELLNVINYKQIPETDISKDINVYEYSDPVHVLEAILTKFKNYEHISDHLKGIVNILYVHTKYMSPKYHISPKLIVHDTSDISEILEAYDNENNPEFKGSLNNLKNAFANHPKSIPSVVYPEGEHPRKFVQALLSKMVHENQIYCHEKIQNFLKMLDPEGNPKSYILPASTLDTTDSVSIKPTEHMHVSNVSELNISPENTSQNNGNGFNLVENTRNITQSDVVQYNTTQNNSNLSPTETNTVYNLELLPEQQNMQQSHPEASVQPKVSNETKLDESYEINTPANLESVEHPSKSMQMEKPDQLNNKVINQDLPIETLRVQKHIDSKTLEPYLNDDNSTESVPIIDHRKNYGNNEMFSDPNEKNFRTSSTVRIPISDHKKYNRINKVNHDSKENSYESPSNSMESQDNEEMVQYPNNVPYLYPGEGQRKYKYGNGNPVPPNYMKHLPRKYLPNRYNAHPNIIPMNNPHRNFVNRNNYLNQFRYPKPQQQLAPYEDNVIQPEEDPNYPYDYPINQPYQLGPRYGRHRNVLNQNLGIHNQGIAPNNPINHPFAYNPSVATNNDHFDGNPARNINEDEPNRRPFHMLHKNQEILKENKHDFDSNVLGKQKNHRNYKPLSHPSRRKGLNENFQSNEQQESSEFKDNDSLPDFRSPFSSNDDAINHPLA